MTTAEAKIARQRRSHKVEKAGYPQSWYAVALSEELPPGKVIGLEFCDGGIILYRDSQGKPHALARYCKHMGADLALGDVVGDNVRCAFHHWQYGPDGACNRLATSDKIPPQARLVGFPTEESWGLIWVFWGLEPLYELPSFHPKVDMSKMVWKAYEIKAHTRFTGGSPWAPGTNVFMGTNGFDYQHLIALHGLPEHQANYDKCNWGKYTIERPSGLINFGIGASAASGEHRLLGLDLPSAYLTGGVRGPKTRRGFMVEAASIGDGSPAALQKARERVDYMHEHHERVIGQDVDILNSLDPSEPGLLVGSDWGIPLYLKWVAAYPFATMEELVRQAEEKGLMQSRNGPGLDAAE